MAKPVKNDEAAYVGLAVFALLILFGIYVNLHHDYYWKEGTKDTCATVYSLTTADAYGNRDLSYSYFVDSVKFKCTSTAASFLCEDSSNCIRYTFKITYAVQNPAVAEFNLANRCDE